MTKAIHSLNYPPATSRTAQNEKNKNENKMTTIEAGDRVIQLVGKFIRSGTVQSVNRGISTVEWDNGKESFETGVFKVGDKMFCEHMPWLGWAAIEVIAEFGVEVRWPKFPSADYYSYESINQGGWVLEAA